MGYTVDTLVVTSTLTVGSLTIGVPLSKFVIPVSGAGSIVVTGTFPTPPYQVFVTTSWVTAYSVTGKGTLQFTVTFSVPPPDSNQAVDLLVM